MKAALARLQATRAYRVWQRYTDGRGRVLAGGIAYFAFFSLFPALTLGFAVFGVVLRDHPALYHDIVHSVSTTLPGIVKDSEHPDGLLDASTPPTLNVLTITGAIAFVVLVFAGLGWLGALREGIRAMFGRPLSRSNAVLRRLLDLGVLALLGLAMLVSAVLSAAANTATAQVLDWLGRSPDSVAGRILLPLVGFLVVLVVDVGIFVLLLRLLSGVSMPWSELRQAAVLGALGAGVLKVAISYGVVGRSTNPVLASLAVVVGLLVVINLMCRVTLFAAAWAAAGPEPAVAATAEQTAEARAAEAAAAERNMARRLPHPRAVEPSFGPRSADRTAIAAGAVIGAVGAVGVGALRRATTAIVSGLRHHD